MQTYLGEASSHFLYQRPHRCDVDALELVGVDRPIFVGVVSDDLQNGQQGHIRLSGTLRSTKHSAVLFPQISVRINKNEKEAKASDMTYRRGTEKKVLVGHQRRIAQPTLDPIQLLETFERWLCPVG